MKIYLIIMEFQRHYVEKQVIGEMKEKNLHQKELLLLK